MLSDLLRIGSELSFVSDADVLIDDAEIDGAGRDIQPDIVALRHAKSLSSQGPVLLITNLQTVL